MRRLKTLKILLLLQGLKKKEGRKGSSNSEFKEPARKSKKGDLTSSKLNFP